MTVKELIALLKTHPDDMPVVFRRYSDYWNFGPSDVYGVNLPEVRRLIPNANGDYEIYYKRQWPKGLPPMVDVLIFPGN